MNEIEREVRKQLKKQPLFIDPQPMTLGMRHGKARVEVKPVPYLFFIYVVICLLTLFRITKLSSNPSSESVIFKKSLWRFFLLHHILCCNCL